MAKENSLLGNLGLSGGVSFGGGGFNPIWIIAGVVGIILIVVLKK